MFPFYIKLVSFFQIKQGFTSQNGAYFSTYDRQRTVTESTVSSPNTNSKNSNSIFTLEQNKQFEYQNYYQRNCASKSGGGWWFNNFLTCLPVNLNGIYVSGASAPFARGIKWQAIRPHDRNYALKKSKIKIRPRYLSSV